MDYKSYKNILLSIFILLVLSTLTFNYIIDPFQHYRITSWYEIPGKKQRKLVPGLAKNFPYETAIIGSSMAENYRVSQINTVFDTESVKLCIAGMTAHELSFLLNTIIKHNRKIKHIIISLDLYSLSGSPTRFRNSSFPTHLYEDSYITDISYLLDLETLKYSFKVIKKSNRTPPDIDKLWIWDNVEFSAKAVRKSMKEKIFNESFVYEDYTSDVLLKSYNENIYTYIKKNQDIKFEILYPPYSYLAYKDMREKLWLEHVFIFKRNILKNKPDNLKIHDFQCIPEITENLDNYKDITHFSPKINRYIINSINNQKHVVKQSNIETCEKITIASSYK